MVNNKDNSVFFLGTIGLIVAPWKFDVLKASIFSLEAYLFYDHQIPVRQLSADSFTTETLYCLITINLPAFYHECRSLIGYATHYLFNK